jgi:hypothetical protein
MNRPINPATPSSAPGLWVFLCVIIQPPTFRVGEGGLRYIVTGERRCAAARMAGLTEISAIYTDSANYDEMSLVENILRSDLTAVEEAEARRFWTTVAKIRPCRNAFSSKLPGRNRSGAW